ncbi:MAG: hypothetical protein ACYCZU_10495, partial [Devosia sp.]
MNAEWIKSPMARRVLVHWADVRPAWLWSEDGRSLRWRNAAARFFNGKLKKHGPKLAPEPVPIKGQVARLIRLGSVGRSSLSRIQFLAGEKPVSATCTVTPLEMPDGNKALLIVDVDPVESELLATSTEQAGDSLAEALFPPDAEYLLVEDGRLAGGSRRGLGRFGPAIEQGGIPALPESEFATVELAGARVILTRFKAGPRDTLLLLLEAADTDATEDRIEDARAEEGLAALDERAPVHGESVMPDGEPVEPLLPMGLPPLNAATEEAGADLDHGIEEDEYWAEPIEPPAVGPGRSLSSLFDRLADHDELYAPLPDNDEGPREEPSPEQPAGESTGSAGIVTHDDAPDVISAVIEFADDPEELEVEPETPTRVTYRVIGRGFTPIPSEEPPPRVDEGPDEPRSEPPVGETTSEVPPDPEIVERVSRYNFNELSRILADRVGTETAPPGEPVEIEAPIEPVHMPVRRATDRALVNVAAETFILNRLPLGIMVFRDQQVLFA